MSPAQKSKLVLRKKKHCGFSKEYVAEITFKYVAATFCLNNSKTQKSMRILKYVEVELSFLF